MNKTSLLMVLVLLAGCSGMETSDEDLALRSQRNLCVAMRSDEPSRLSECNRLRTATR